MKKFGIINRKLNDALAALGHGDICLITDAGYPLPYDAQPGAMSVDLAITQDLPTISVVLKLVNNELVYEECYVAQTQKDYNPQLYNDVVGIVKRCSVQAIDPDKIMGMGRKAKVIIRTGHYSPWGNIALVAGVNAPLWFSKPGVVVPEFYKERVNFKDEDFPW